MKTTALGLFVLSFALSGCVPPAEAAPPQNNNINSPIENYVGAMAVGILTPTTRFAGGWKSRGENVDGFTCSWQNPGTVHSVQEGGSVFIQIWSYALDKEICSCDFAACAVNSGIPSDCTCSNTPTSLGGYYGLRVKDGNCETWPEHMFCNVALNKN